MTQFRSSSWLSGWPFHFPLFRLPQTVPSCLWQKPAICRWISYRQQITCWFHVCLSRCQRPGWWLRPVFKDNCTIFFNTHHCPLKPKLVGSKKSRNRITKAHYFPFLHKENEKKKKERERHTHNSHGHVEWERREQGKKVNQSALKRRKRWSKAEVLCWQRISVRTPCWTFYDAVHSMWLWYSTLTLEKLTFYIIFLPFSFLTPSTWQTWATADTKPIPSLLLPDFS